MNFLELFFREEIEETGISFLTGDSETFIVCFIYVMFNFTD